MNVIHAVTLPESPIWVNTKAEDAKSEVLGMAEIVASVTNDATREIAVVALRDCKGLMKQTEDSRVAVKAPFLAACKLIDKTAKLFIVEVERESNRITRLITDYEHEQRQKREEAERKQRQEAARLEQESIKAQQDARNAKTQEAEREAVDRMKQAKVEQQQVLSAVVAAKEKPEGVSVKADWDFDVVDPVKVYASRPDLCEITVKRRETLDAVRSGLRNCPGLLIREVTKVMVR